MADESKYPECEKWAVVHKEAMAIQAFLETLSHKGIVLCEHFGDNDRLAYTHKTNEQLVYEHFGIDGSKIEAERREMIENI